MKTEEKTLNFLLGAHTPQGYVSRFDQLAEENQGWRTFILKGGPGSGKSTLLKKIAERFAPDPGLELILCSSDMRRLDAVLLPERKLAVVDGTQPHLLEPKYPGAVESVVDLSVCQDTDILYSNRSAIVSLTDSISRCHEYCSRYLAAGSSLTGDNYRLTLEGVDMEKLNGYLGRLSEREIKPKKAAAAEGRERVRFLTAVTERGVVKLTGTAKLLAERIYLINDEWGAISRLILYHIRAKALSAGYDVISCYCPLSPFEKLEQLFIPELAVGFLTSNRSHDFDLEIDPYRIINCRRFTDLEKLKGAKKRISGNRKAVDHMIAQAGALLKEAKALADELKAYYTAATRFEEADRITRRLIEKIE
ncbi:MAG: hypothetical protein LBU86_01050 [Oscillospiraceae bacterium]|jgi:hypothetical protein|nr:hypothetical protein [Oscillospiraceae bacterium]